MTYIGNNLTIQQYAPQVAYFSGNGSTTAFTLPVAVVSTAQIIVIVANVIQNPSSAYSVSGTTLTFTSAPPSGTNNIWVEYTSLQTNLIQPAAGTVNTSQFVNPPTMPSNGMLNATWTTTTRPSPPVAGQMGFNSQKSALEYYSGITWITLGGAYAASVVTVGGGGGATGGTSGVNYGAGGAGGVLRTTSLTLTPGIVYSAVVGAGGVGVSTGTPSASGSSTFTTATTATGGGAVSSTSLSGASNADFSGAGAPGGTSAGAGAGAGGNGSGLTGGVGATSAISGSTTYYGGGGGGGNGSPQSGGTGGGGSGGTPGTSGTVNTGGGGGGSQSGNFTNGGSGIVILSVPSVSYSGTTSGSPTITTSGANTIITFNSSGSYTA